jgi:hypothetical protein
MPTNAFEKIPMKTVVKKFRLALRVKFSRIKREAHSF